MTHPTREEWITHLYGEAEAGSRTQLEAHLKSCEQCRDSVAELETTMNGMDAWKLPRTRQQTGLRWAPLAAAAAVVALATIGGMRLWTLEGQVRELRGELAQKAADSSIASLREEMRQMASENARVRTGDRDAFAAALQRSQAAATANYATLRKELETVAILTEAGFESTQSEIAQLATTARDNTPAQ